MTIRARILWVMGMALLLVSLMAVLNYLGASKGQRLRRQLMTLQTRIDGFERLRALAWPFVNGLGQARQTGEDTSLVLEDMQARVKMELERLERLDGEESGARTRRIGDAVLGWAELAQRRVRQLPSNVSVEPQVEWLLYSEFEQTVGQTLRGAQQVERVELARLQVLMDENVWRTRWVAALVVPLLILLLLGLVTGAVLVPLHRAFTTLTDMAHRVGRGDFDIDDPLRSADEAGLLSSALSRMARELRESLEERQRMVRAEAEASEREARRYHALLEDTVRARTAELADANTRLRDSLRELEATQQQLLSADRLASVGRLAAGVGHEINNPLAYILSNLRYVHQELRELLGAPSEDVRLEMIAALAEAEEGAERVRLIVQDLKTLARPDDVALGPVNVAAVVRSSMKMARHEAHERARLVEECDGVPPVQANAARLGQVFLNLLINAAHAIEPGRARDNEIRVRAHLSAPRRVTVEVHDTGAGIAPEHLRRIFDPFFTTKPVGVGTGLGLSVCHRIITSLGGDIRVESEPGRGTCFFVTLPVAEDIQSGVNGPSSSVA